MQYTCDPLRMCPLKSHRTPGPASDQIGQPYKHPKLENGPKDLVLRIFPYLSFFIKGEVATYLATKNVALLFSRVKTLNLGNPHSTMVVWLWIPSVSNYCTRISPSCDVMISPHLYGRMATCHIQDCRPSTAHIEGHHQQWLLPNQWTSGLAIGYEKPVI